MYKIAIGLQNIMKMAKKIASDPTHFLHHQYILFPQEGDTECQMYELKVPWHN